MTAPSPCDRLDAYLDGRLAPDEEAAFEAHLSACEACLEEPVLPVDDRAHLLAVACPPEVVEAALRRARQAPDRAPLAAPSRRRYGWAIAALLAAATVLWVRPASEAPAPVQVADAAAPAPDPAPVAPPASVDGGAPSVPEAPPQTPPPTPAPSAPRASPPSQPAQATAPPDLAAVAPEPPADSVAMARDEVLLAFAIVADAQGRAAGAVADGVGRVSDALHSTPHLLAPHTP